MRAGRLRHIVTLQQPQAEQSQYGEKILKWADVEKVWAGIEAAKGDVIYAADQKYHESETVVIIRWRADVTPGWRVIHDQKRVLEITHVDDRNGTCTELYLRCRWCKEKVYADKH